MKNFKHLLVYTLIICLGIFLFGACSPKNSAVLPSNTGNASQTESIKEETEPVSEAAESLDTGSFEETEGTSTGSETRSAGVDIDEDGQYTSKEDVALYIHTYGRLPSNFITKSQAQDAGWNSKKGNLDKVLPGMSIGGDRFGNREGILPKASSRKYYECDIDYTGGHRSGKRIVFSDDGLIFYTDDHYKSFTQLY